MKPWIGVVPLVDETRDSYWMLPGYFEGVLQAGGLPVMLPLTDDPAAIEQLTASFAGFLFTGGHDVSPALYGEAPLPEYGACVPLRDRMEEHLLHTALRADKPVLGICRGLQLMNAALGGTLYQDLPSERPSPLTHHQQPPYDVPVHRVTLTPDAPLHRLLQTGQLAVNSYHHQAVKVLAPVLREMAQAEDGLIEAAYVPGKRFAWGVQWHPEFSWRTDENSRRIFGAFIRAAAAVSEPDEGSSPP